MLYSTFYLDGTLMGLPIPCILEIGRAFKIHPIQGAPELVDGLINLRGKVVTIVNTGLAFGGTKVQQTQNWTSRLPPITSASTSTKSQM
jgi:chemotaxis signal transduction protein